MRIKAIPEEAVKLVSLHPAIVMGGLAAAGIGAYMYIGAPAPVTDTAGATTDASSLTPAVSGYAPVSGGISGGGGGGGGISFGVTGSDASAAPAADSSASAASATPAFVGSPSASSASTDAAPGYSVNDLLAAFSSGVKTGSGSTTQQVALNGTTLPDGGFITPSVSTVGPDGSITTIPGMVTGNVTTRELLDFQTIQENHNYDLAMANLNLNHDALDAQVGLSYAQLQSSNYLTWAGIQAGLYSTAVNANASMYEAAVNADATKYAADSAAKSSSIVAASGLAQSLASNGNPVNIGTVTIGGQTVSFDTLSPAPSDSKHNRDYNNLEQLLGSGSFSSAAAAILGNNASATPAAPAPTYSAPAVASVPYTPVPMPYLPAPAVVANIPVANTYQQYMAPTPAYQAPQAVTQSYSPPAASAPTPAPAPAPAPVYQAPPVPSYVAPAIDRVSPLIQSRPTTAKGGARAQLQ